MTFEHLEASSLALSPTEWSSEEPLSRITKDAKIQEPHLDISDKVAVSRFDTLTAKLGNSTLVQ
ncbi:unnamed protein product, partial [Heterotrigona itama]